MAACAAASSADAPLGCVLLARARDAEALKEALRGACLLDGARRPTREADGTLVALPCAAAAATAPQLLPAAIVAAVAAGAAHWSERPVAPKRTAGGAQQPAAAIRAALASLLAPAQAPHQLLEDLPRRWEKLGDVALLPATCMRHPLWAQHAGLQARLLPLIAAALDVTRVAQQAEVDPGPRRSSRAAMLHPAGCADGWTVVRENGLLYTLDVTQSMFSSGNGTEKARMGALRCAGETVVDLFAGIGYYTLPLLLHARAAHVFACDINPPSLEALRRGLALNAVPPEACTVLAGDCAETAPKGVAHRVLLGLLPSSECGWAAAVAALRDDCGGVLHVHGNVRAGGQAEWAADAAERLRQLAAALPGRAQWAARVTHVETVKSYAPRVLHVVADIALAPPQQPRTTSLPPSPAKELCSPPPLLRLQSPSGAELHARAVAARQPAVLCGLDFGAAASTWSAAHLAGHPDAAADVAVHVSATAALDWHARNFAYETMPLRRLVAAASAGGAHLYMRAVGREPRREPASLAASFPGLAAELALPQACLPPPQEGPPHSVVLRVASPGLALWLHYDVLDNVLVQLVGAKRVLLFPPAAAGGLALRGSSSAVPTAWLWPHAARSANAARADAARLAAEFPRFAGARSQALEVTLQPGEALFVPALWAHAVTSDDFSVAVNVFWPPRADAFELRGAAAAPPKDVYGNADCAAGAAALAAAEAAAAALRRLPPDAAAFYGARAQAMLQDAMER